MSSFGTPRADAAGSVRLGPVSIFVLVMGVCLAVLSLLCVTTAQAELATAERQRATLEATYANEAVGQELLGAVCGALAQARAQGLGAEQAGTLVDQAAAQVAQEASASDVLCQCQRDGSVLSATVTSGNGRTLQVELAWDDALRCSVRAWAVWSQIPEDPGPGLWTGGSADAAGASDLADSAGPSGPADPS